MQRFKLDVDVPGCWAPVAAATDRFGCVTHMPHDAFSASAYSL